MRPLFWRNQQRFPCLTADNLELLSNSCVSAKSAIESQNRLFYYRHLPLTHYLQDRYDRLSIYRTRYLVRRSMSYGHAFLVPWPLSRLLSSSHENYRPCTDLVFRDKHNIRKPLTTMERLVLNQAVA